MLEQTHKLLLRAEAFNKNAIQPLKQAMNCDEEWQQRHERWKVEAEERDRKLDERVNNLVAAIADLIRRIPPGNLRDAP